jgi:hypothetical protein
MAEHLPTIFVDGLSETLEILCGIAVSQRNAPDLRRLCLNVVITWAEKKLVTVGSNRMAVVLLIHPCNPGFAKSLLGEGVASCFSNAH